MILKILFGSYLLAFSYLQSTASPVETKTKEEKVIYSTGAIVLYSPKYLGSDQSQLKAYPLLSAKQGKIWSLGITGGDYLISEAFGMEHRIIGNLYFGRYEKDYDSKFKGIGNIYPTLELGFKSYKKSKIGNFTLKVLTDAVQLGHKGSLLNAGVDGVVFFIPPRILIKLGLNVEYADHNYLNAHYGISKKQSKKIANPDISRYHLKTGHHFYSYTFSAVYPISPSYVTIFSYTTKLLSNQVKKSPLTLVDKAEGWNFLFIYNL